MVIFPKGYFGKMREIREIRGNGGIWGIGGVFMGFGDLEKGFRNFKGFLENT
jgi:hypothetical protein